LVVLLLLAALSPDSPDSPVRWRTAAIPKLVAPEQLVAAYSLIKSR